jgi:hypothetical protein
MVKEEAVQASTKQSKLRIEETGMDIGWVRRPE